MISWYIQVLWLSVFTTKIRCFFMAGRWLHMQIQVPNAFPLPLPLCSRSRKNCIFHVFFFIYFYESSLLWFSLYFLFPYLSHSLFYKWVHLWLPFSALFILPWTFSHILQFSFLARPEHTHWNIVFLSFHFHFLFSSTPGFKFSPFLPDVTFFLYICWCLSFPGTFLPFSYFVH